MAAKFKRDENLTAWVATLTCSESSECSGGPAVEGFGARLCSSARSHSGFSDTSSTRHPGSPRFCLLSLCLACSLSRRLELGGSLIVYCST
jgi:hypothetical protein